MEHLQTYLQSYFTVTLMICSENEPWKQAIGIMPCTSFVQQIFSDISRQTFPMLELHFMHQDCLYQRNMNANIVQ